MFYAEVEKKDGSILAFEGICHISLDSYKDHTYQKKGIRLFRRDGSDDWIAHDDIENLIMCLQDS